MDHCGLGEPDRWAGALRGVELYRHEVRRLGRTACAAPVLAIALTLALAALAVGNGAGRAQVSEIVLVGLEAVLPLAVALAAISVVAADRVRELYLSLPTRYARVLGRRLGLLAVLTATVAGALVTGALATGVWSGPSALVSPLIWAPPAGCLAGLGVLTALLTGSQALAAMVPSGLWLASQVFASAFTARDWTRPFYLFPVSRLEAYPGWTTDRLWLAAAMVPLAAGVVVALCRSEQILVEEDV